MNLSDKLAAWLAPQKPIRFGELRLLFDGATYEARHQDDVDSEELEQKDSGAALREVAKFDAKEEYRPLKTAPTLRSGWVTSTPDPVEFLRRIDAIYPAVFATWIAYDDGTLDPVPLRSTLDRQTGMYRFAGSITDQMANRIMREVCSPGCLRKIAWPISDESPVSRLTANRSIPVICTEACTFAVTEARRLVKEAYDKENAPPD